MRIFILRITGSNNPKRDCQKMLFHWILLPKIFFWDRMVETRYLLIFTDAGNESTTFPVCGITCNQLTDFQVASKKHQTRPAECLPFSPLFFQFLFHVSFGKRLVICNLPAQKHLRRFLELKFFTWSDISQNKSDGRTWWRKSAIHFLRPKLKTLSLVASSQR